MKDITACLWFDGQAEEAANLYVSIFPNSKIGDISRYGDTGPGPKGSVMMVTFELDGRKFSGLNGGPMFKFTEAVSFSVACESQAEVDHYWDSLLADGGQPSQCGWLKDRFGLSWQIVPTILGKLAADPDWAKAGRVMQAMLKMVKLDIAELEAAARG
ncbi:MAG: VOC family protein [Phenylobacterium sp.]|uniref:VOC family protein n=1 Tax=Phenylobacterium sp. TaxID=1871053 RepID=UPI00273274CE|nr:VOC family protein [Phenylobacterium sp.]MDP3175018.1 VOC family protein [Phenylobacterium sp.]